MPARRVRPVLRARLARLASKVRLANRARWVRRMPRQDHRVPQAPPDRTAHKGQKALRASRVPQAAMVRPALQARKDRKARLVLKAL